MARWGKEIGNSVMDWILHSAGCAMESPFKNLFLVLLVNLEREISFADRTAENIHK
jgi:hypothetical protein